MPRWTKIILKTFAAIIVLILVAFIAFGLYVGSHKKELLISITKKLNENLNGSLTVRDIDPSFFSSFPGVSISLKDVIVKDERWNIHKHTLLEAKRFNISVNVMALLKGTVLIKKIDINNAAVYLYTDSSGYSNTSIFKKKKEEKKSTDNSNPPEVNKFSLNQVTFIMDNQKGYKLFQFEVNKLDGKIDYLLLGGWHADLKLNTMVRSLAFNTTKGSFIKDKLLQGPFSIDYNNKENIIVVAPNQLKIGEENFVIGAKFAVGNGPADFIINIAAPEILWSHASALLSPNISAKLNMFNLETPISVTCDLVGNMGASGDPSINVKATVRNNILQVPGGKIQSCNFDGAYTNGNIKGRAFDDANSAVRLYHLKGEYEQIPFSIDTASILNFDRPIATGVFKSNFEISKLNNLLGEDLLNFTKGTANVKLAYKADIVNFELTKPYVMGFVDIKNADVNYIPRKLKFKNTSISLDFTNKDLFIKNIRLQSGKSIVNMEGSIQNFLNLYYNAPEKIVLNWQIKSPQLYLGEFLGFLSARQQLPVKRKKKQANSNFSDQLSTVFDKSNVNMHVTVDKVYYKKFLATGANADILLSQSGIKIKNVTVKHSGGSLKLNGSLNQGENNHLAVNAIISNVDIKNFFYSFNNFGLTSLTSQNLKGYLSSKVRITGILSNQGDILKNSINGNVIFALKKGALINFSPITGVGKFAFPLRDLNNITFSNLNGNIDITGEKIKINPMKISSSVLNMNVAGVYSLGMGTNIALDIPLRNPKKDAKLATSAERKEKRMKGIVLHILATDGDNGKIKFKWNKNHD